MSSTLYFLRARPAAILSLDTDSGEVSIVLGSAAGVPDGIRVDRSGNSIYWTNMGAWPAFGEDFFAADGAVERCDLDGTNHRVLVGSGTIVTPKQLQHDPASGHLYWCDREGMAVFRCRVDGTELTPLLRTGAWPHDMADVMRHCVGIAIDPVARHLYWTQKGPPNGGRGRIFRMNLDIPAGATAETREDVELLVDDLPEPIDLEIDHERRQLYWTDRGDPKIHGNSVYRADIFPQGLGKPRIMAVGLKEGIGLALDPLRRRAFVSDLSGAIRTLALDDEGRGFDTIHECYAPITGLAFSA